MSISKQIYFVIPSGTKVLTRTDGRVGIVIHTPGALEHKYRVRFADGKEDSYHRSELTIFKMRKYQVALMSQTFNVS